MNVFTNLGTELLGHLAEYLEGNDIIKLVICGNRQLEYMLIQGVRQLDCVLPRFALFPRVVFDFPRASKIVVQLRKHHLFYPLRLERHHVPPRPLQTLTKLVFNFGQCHRLLDDFSFAETSLPNLTELSLIGNCATALKPEHAQALPRKLVKFEFRALLGPIAVDPTFVSQLPPGLTDLAMSILPATENPALPYPHQMTISWPQALQFLDCSLVPSAIEFLPPSITHLNILFFKNPRSVFPWPPQFVWPHGYPSELQHLAVATTIHLKAGEIRNLIPLPPNLTHVQIRPAVQSSLVKDDKIPDLPLPSSLTSVPNIAKIFSERRISATALPPRLTALNIGNKLEELTTSIVPAHLTSLTDTPGQTEENFDLLPSSILTLCIPLRDYAILHQLPKHLTSLELSNWRSDEPVPLKVWEAVPKTLTSLALHLRRVESFALLDLLPNLRTFVLFTPEPGAIQPSHLFLGRHLPRGLEKLVFGTGRHLWPCVPIWLTQLSYCQTLQSLTLSYRFHAFDALPPGHFDYDWIKTLPTSLTNLCFPIGHHFSSQLDALYHLPRALACLRLTNKVEEGYHRRQKLELQDAHFAQLPTSLTTLHLPAEHTGLTEQIFTYLPPYILHLSGFPPHLDLQMQKYYSNNEIWQGWKHWPGQPV